MISLTPIKYGEIPSSEGGPIDRLEYASIDLYGVPCTHAVAYLRDDLFLLDVKSQGVTAPPDGAGSNESPQIACHMAISEALERWAVHYCRIHREDYTRVIKFDTISNGFAAFPGLFKR